MSNLEPYSSDTEDILTFKVAAAAAQHALAKAMLRAKKKKRSRDDDSSMEDVSLSQKGKKKKRHADSSTPVDSDTESESDSMAAESPSSVQPSDSPPSKHTKGPKPKAKVKSSTSTHEPVPESFYKTEHTKVPKGMHVSFPQGANAFSASPWGLKNDTAGWNDFLAYIRVAVDGHFNTTKGWKDQRGKHASFHEKVLKEYPILRHQHGFFTITKAASANLRYQKNNPTASKSLPRTKSRKRASTSATPSTSTSSASTTHPSPPESVAVGTPRSEETEEMFIDPTLFHSVPVLSMGGVDYGLPDIEHFAMQTPAPAPAITQPGVNPDTHFDGSYPANTASSGPSMKSRRVMVYQTAPPADAISLSQHAQDSAETTSALNVLDSGLSSAMNDAAAKVASSDVSITPSDAAAILLHMHQGAPKSHGTEQAPTSLPPNNAAFNPTGTTAAKPRTRTPAAKSMNNSGKAPKAAPVAKASLDAKTRRSTRSQKK